MATLLERGASGDGWAQGRVGNVVFLIYQTCVPDEAVDQSFECIGHSVERHPRGIAMVAVFGERTRVPSAQTRRRIAAYLTGVGEKLLIGTTVIEGDSMSAGVKRVATTMMTTLLKPPYPHKTVRSVALACDYVASRAVDDSGARLAQGALFSASIALRSGLSTGLGSGSSGS